MRGCSGFSLRAQVLISAVSMVLLYFGCNHLSNTAIERQAERKELRDSGRRFFEAAKALRETGHLPPDMKFPDTPLGRQDMVLVGYAEKETSRMTAANGELSAAANEMDKWLSDEKAPAKTLADSIAGHEKAVAILLGQCRSDFQAMRTSLEALDREANDDTLTRLLKADPSPNEFSVRAYKVIIRMLRDMRQMVVLSIEHQQGHDRTAQILKLQSDMGRAQKEFDELQAAAENKMLELSKQAEKLGFKNRDPK